MAKNIKYSLELFEKVCELIGNGRTLTSICEEEGMPAYSTVMYWLSEAEREKREGTAKRKYVGILERYAHAREKQADHLFEECLDIADSVPLEATINATTGKVTLKGEDYARARLRIDTRKWMAGKLRPKKYGDSLELKGDKENPITQPAGDTTISIAQLITDKLVIKRNEKLDEEY